MEFDQLDYLETSQERDAADSPAHIGFVGAKSTIAPAQPAIQGVTMDRYADEMNDIDRMYSWGRR